LEFGDERGNRFRRDRRVCGADDADELLALEVDVAVAGDSHRISGAGAEAGRALEGDDDRRLDGNRRAEHERGQIHHARLDTAANLFDRAPSNLPGRWSTGV